MLGQEGGCSAPHPRRASIWCCSPEEEEEEDEGSWPGAPGPAVTAGTGQEQGCSPQGWLLVTVLCVVPVSPSSPCLLFSLFLGKKKKRCLKE